MTQYDKIATEYLDYKQSNTRREDIEYYTFLHRLVLPALNINDVTTINLKKILAGSCVLDLGCGAGYLARKLAEELGCEDVVGIDISESMIDIGRNIEKAHPLGIIYHVADVLHLSIPEKKFDFVVAFYILNYAKTRDELEEMIQIISNQLHDNDKAHFLSITGNVCETIHIVNSDRYCKYGYHAEAELPLVDGTQIKNTHFNSDGSSFLYITYYFSPSTYEQAFKKAGFKYFEWVPVVAAPGTNKYEDFLKCPGMIGILAHK